MERETSGADGVSSVDWRRDGGPAVPMTQEIWPLLLARRVARLPGHEQQRVLNEFLRAVERAEQRGQLASN